METRQTTDASLVFDLLIRAGYTSGTPEEENFYYAANSSTLALQQDWDYQYSHGQDA